MKNIKTLLLLFVTLVNTTLVAQYEGRFDDYQYANLLDKYVIEFVELAGDIGGIDLTPIYDKPILMEWIELPDDIVGYSWGMLDDSMVYIEIDNKMFNTYDDLKRAALLYHELAHDIFNAAHTDEPGHIMNPFIKDYKRGELWQEMVKLFDQYRNGTLKIATGDAAARCPYKITAKHTHE